MRFFSAGAFPLTPKLAKDRLRKPQDLGTHPSCVQGSGATRDAPFHPGFLGGGRRSPHGVLRLDSAHVRCPALLTALSSRCRLPRVGGAATRLASRLRRRAWRSGAAGKPSPVGTTHRAPPATIRRYASWSPDACPSGDFYGDSEGGGGGPSRHQTQAVDRRTFTTPWFVSMPRLRVDPETDRDPEWWGGWAWDWEGGGAGITCAHPGSLSCAVQLVSGGTLESKVR